MVLELVRCCEGVCLGRSSSFFGAQKATLGRFPPTPAPFASVLPGGLQTSKAFLAQSFSLLEAIFVLCFSRVP